MKKDNFMFYLWWHWIAMIATFFVVFTLETALWWIICCTVIGLVLFVVHVEINYNKSIKLWSPVPLRLNGIWTFSFYLVEATHMVSPQFLLHQELTKENT